jgi:DNA-directed RNA polymerase subunit RPC12/RpoP
VHSTRSAQVRAFDCAGLESARIKCPDCGLRFVPKKRGHSLSRSIAF